MPLNHEEAAATIQVTGVSIGCINRDMNRWEVAFIRHPTHSLAMKVDRESNGQTETMFPNSPIPVRCAITIEATNNTNPEARIAEEAEGTDEDFDKILDIERKLYDGEAVTFKERPELEVTPLFVPRALLYAVADKLTEFPVRVVRKDDRDHNTVDVFDQVATTTGADITCGEGGGEVTISVAGEGGFVLILPHEEGTRYVITFDNTCPPAKAPDGEAEGENAAAGNAAGEDEDDSAEGGSAEAEESSDAGARLLRKTTASGVILVDKHSDFVLCYALIDPPAGREEFDLVDDEDPDDSDRGDGAVCINSHLGVSGGIKFP